MRHYAIRQFYNPHYIFVEVTKFCSLVDWSNCMLKIAETLFGNVYESFVVGRVALRGYAK